MNEVKYPREGNDCWLCDYICILRLDAHKYIVVHTKAVSGSWTGNQEETQTSEVYYDYNDALAYMDKIMKEVIR